MANFLVPGSRSLTCLKHDDYVTRYFRGSQGVGKKTQTKLCKRMISTKCYMFIFVYHIALLPRRAESG